MSLCFMGKKVRYDGIAKSLKRSNMALKWLCWKKAHHHVGVAIFMMAHIAATKFLAKEWPQRYYASMGLRYFLKMNWLRQIGFCEACRRIEVGVAINELKLSRDLIAGSGFVGNCLFFTKTNRVAKCACIALAMFAGWTARHWRLGRILK